MESNNRPTKEADVPQLVFSCQVTLTSPLACETATWMKSGHESANVCVSVSWVMWAGWVHRVAWPFDVHSTKGESSGGLGVARWRRKAHPLVQCPAAVLRPTQAGDLVVLQRELVVVGDLLVDGDGLLRVDHNLFLGLYCDYLGVAVWLEEQSNKRRMRNSARRIWKWTFQMFFVSYIGEGTRIRLFSFGDVVSFFTFLYLGNIPRKSCK